MTRIIKHNNTKRQSCPSSLCLGKHHIGVIDNETQTNDRIDEHEYDSNIDNIANNERKIQTNGNSSSPPRRRSSAPVVCRGYSLPYTHTVDGDDRTRNNAMGRSIHRRSSLFVEGQCLAKNDNNVEVSNEDLDTFFENAFGDEDADHLDGDDRSRNNTMGRTNHRRCHSSLVEGQCLATNDNNMEVSNEHLDFFENAFGDEDVDHLDDNLSLSQVKEDCKLFAEAERHLSLTMNFDIKSFSFPDGEESHRASISFAEIKLDHSNIARHQQSKIEQAAHIAKTTGTPPFFTGNLAKYYMTMKDNLCETMVTSEETRVVLEKMNEDVYGRVPQLREYIKKKVLKRSRQEKHVLRQKLSLIKSVR